MVEVYTTLQITFMSLDILSNEELVHSYILRVFIFQEVQFSWPKNKEKSKRTVPYQIYNSVFHNLINRACGYESILSI